MDGRPARLRRRPGRGNRRAPGRPRRVAWRARCPYRARVRPLRRAADRGRGRVALSAVPAHCGWRNRRRRHRSRPRRLGRQGARPAGRRDAAGGDRAARAAAAEREVPHRGRGGDRQPELARIRARPRARTRLRPGDLRRRGAVAPRRAVAVRRVQGPGRVHDHGRGRPGRPALRPLRRHGRQPRARARGDPGEPAPPGRVGRGARVLRLGHPAERGAARATRRGAVRRRAVRRGTRCPRDRRRGGLLHPGALVGTADTGGQRGGRRRPLHRDPARRARLRLVPARRRPGPGGRARGGPRARRAPRRPRGARHRRAGRRGGARLPHRRAPGDRREDGRPAIRLPGPGGAPGGHRGHAARHHPVRARPRGKDAVLLLLHRRREAARPNEFLRLRRVHEGMRAWDALLTALADGPARLDRVRLPESAGAGA